MTRIQLSRRPFVFGINLLLFPNKPILYFDREFLYAESRKAKKKFPIESVTRLRDTWSKINHQIVWEVEGRHEGEYFVYTFVTKRAWI